MKKTLNNAISPRRNRSKRRSGMVRGDIFKTLVIVGLAGSLGLLMVYAYNFVLCADYFLLKQAAVRGCKRISEREIKDIIGISAPLNILTVNLGKMKQDIEKNPWIRSASVGREFPDRLVIEVSERNAAALLKKENELYVLDMDGVVFKKFESDDIVDVPVLTGFYRGDTLQIDLLERTFAFLGYLSERDSFPRKWNISEVYTDDAYGFSVFTDDHLFLNLGFDDYDKKFMRLNRVMDNLTRRGLDKNFLSIDLVDPSRVVVQQGPPPVSGRKHGESRKTKI